MLSAFNARAPYRFMLDDPPEDLASAYALQSSFMEKRANGQPFGGFKIAYTTPVMQKRINASEPAFGRVLASDIRPSPAVLDTRDYIALELECEVAIRFAQDLPLDQTLTDEDVFAAIASVMLAFEIVDRRPFLGEKSLFQSIAMNVLNAGIITGSPITDWSSRSLDKSVCTLSIDGREVGRGTGADVNGHPVKPSAWLANALSNHGLSIRAGDIVITGSMIPPTPLLAGQRAQLTMDGLGDIEVTAT